MRSFLPPFSAALAACAPAPQETPVRAADPVADAAQVAGGPVSAAAQGPIPEAVSAAENPFPGTSTDRGAAAQGRRILSTAFVRLGPGEHLMVTLRNGMVLALRDVTMGNAQFCGVATTGDIAGKRQCRAYAEVAAASPRAMRTQAPASADAGVAASPRTPGAPR